MSFEVRADDDVDRFDEFEDVPEPGFDLRSGGTDLFRAVMILLLAVAVGILILTRGVDNPGGVVADPDNETSAATDDVASEDESGEGADLTSDDPAAPAADALADATATDGTNDAAMTDGGTTTETTAIADADTTATTADSSLTLGEGSAARDPQEVEVLVLNATDKKGIAAQAAELLQNSSYNTAPAGNATVEGLGSVIFYMEGYRPDAIAVAGVFTDGLDGLVQPYDPTRPPSDEIGSANVIVVLGIDEAIPIE